MYKSINSDMKKIISWNQTYSILWQKPWREGQVDGREDLFPVRRPEQAGPFSRRKTWTQRRDQTWPSWNVGSQGSAESFSVVHSHTRKCTFFHSSCWLQTSKSDFIRLNRRFQFWLRDLPIFSICPPPLFFRSSFPSKKLFSFWNISSSYINICSRVCWWHLNRHFNMKEKWQNPKLKQIKSWFNTVKRGDFKCSKWTPCLSCAARGRRS